MLYNVSVYGKFAKIPLKNQIIILANLGEITFASAEYQRAKIIEPHIPC